MAGNATNVICKKITYITSYSIWQNDYTLAPTVLFTAQLIVISLASKFIDLWLRQLGQTSCVSQIIAGILLGPSLLGQHEEARRTLFPREGRMTLATLASFGNMFYHFLIAVKTDTQMLLRPGRKAVCIATCAFSSTLCLSFLLALVLRKYVHMDSNLNSSLVLIAMTQAFTGISVISFLITELKIQNTDVGRLSLAVAVFTDALNITAITITFALGDGSQMMWPFITIFGLIVVVFFLIRPIILRMMKKIPAGKPADRKHVFVIMILVLILGFVSEAIGQHYLLGPTMLGIVVPEGPPLGAAVVTRLDTFISGFLYPTYLAINGLQTNIFDIKPSELWVMVILVGFSIVVKTAAVMGASMFMDLQARDAFVLSMILNCKGILELSIYNLWKENKILQGEEFTLCVVSVIVTTAVMTPLIRHIYDPMKQSQPFKRNTIQHAKKDSEFRLLVCISNSENVPTIVNLLEVSHATTESPISVISLFLVELVGRYAPILISNDCQDSKHNVDASAASTIANALRLYEKKNKRCAIVESFTSISEFNTMHLDIIRLAIERRTNFIIMPYHKQWAIDGNVGSTNPGIRRLNKNILDRAPCSVGILVDRGILTGSNLSVMSSKLKFKVAVIFIGGPDDLESLAYGARMGKHEDVNLTVVRFLLFGNENSIERKRDSEHIFQIKQSNAGNDRFMYVEEVVRDGVGLCQCIGEIVKQFDMILVGRFHQKSPIFIGLEMWSECPELGLIGDMLASPDFKTTASVLVVQQQKKNMRSAKRNSRAVVPDNSSWSISIEHES